MRAFLLAAALCAFAGAQTAPRSDVMGAGREGHTAVPLEGGKVLVAGGFGEGQALNSVEVYDQG
ncbi:MAG: kelch repeat-containing protein, partial [Elusimicrobia bacterium]|nr:kelch repeat-containing protein [Elusimicrobiota bacterium]